MKPIPDELLEQLLKDYEKPEDLLGSEGLLASLQKAVMERAVEAELTAHLGYERHAPAGAAATAATAMAARRSSPTATRWSWTCRGTATGASNRSWSRSVRPGCPASTGK